MKISQMKLNSIHILSIITLLLFSCSSEVNEIEEDTIESTNSIYYPPVNSLNWETKSVSDLNWNANQIQPLLTFLEDKNTKGFIILHQGKIVIEEYFNNHSINSNWYWASAGKTLTAALAGIAQENGFMDINNKVSEYLGNNWTSIPIEKENLITTKHLLSMTSGLDDNMGDDISTTNLQYVADAGTRWAYHNVYLKTQDIVATAANTTWNNYFNTQLKNKIGMSGSWIPLNNLNVYWSNTRSMARFGLLIAANGKWENAQIISKDFLNEATSTSQNINKAYGYLWWLNGNDTYRLPQSQHEFQGTLITAAPNDMYAALGKNDQKIYIVPSKNIVIVRMGNSADNSNFALSNFDNELWTKINLLIN